MASTDTRNSVDWSGGTGPLLAAIALLSVAGMLVAGYLTYTHFDRDALVCSVGECGTVQDSAYASLGPIPISLLGVGMYVLLGVLAIARRSHAGLLSFEHASIASWSLAFMGTLYAAYLTYVEIWVIDAICQWCVISAIVGLLILVVETVVIWRVLLSDDAPMSESHR
ncbi:MAG TPA: vitamin K epoxide reductase family protein [Thermomicrobiales bacterium]|nr:vitamin K epoxide reductase family protein [Thermomicrobiales bacterium]